MKARSKHRIDVSKLSGLLYQLDHEIISLKLTFPCRSLLFWVKYSIWNHHGENTCAPENCSEIFK